MESKVKYKYYHIIKKIKDYFECKFHNTKYIAYCSLCKQNICQKCLTKNLFHKGHKIFYFQKIMFTDKQIKYYHTLYFLCTFYLKRIREIVIELLSDLSEIIESLKNSKNYPLLLNIKNVLKNTYKRFYKINIYQMQYAKSNLELFIHCRKWGYINFQVIENIYNIKLNSVKIPELSDKDIINKIEIMIEFMKDNKTNNILRASDSPHPSTFYSYIDYNSNNPKVNTYKVKLSCLLFDINKGGEIFQPNPNELENINTNLNNSSSNIETDDTENYMEIDTVSNNNLIKDKIDNNHNNNLKVKNDKTEDLKKINKRFNSLKEKFSKINFTTKNHKKEDEIESENNIKNKIYKNIEYCYKYSIKNKKENKSLDKINLENEKNQENEIKNYLNQNKKIKSYIYDNLSKSCKEEVEYRDNIKYIYLDKYEKREIVCAYYGEYKKGTLKRHGRGLFIWEDGEYYLGYWENDKRDGEGTNKYSNGNIYKGNYKNGKKEGNGMYKWKNGDIYEGKWKNDMKDGKGKYKFSNGDVYDGFFKMDKMDGNGTYTWANKVEIKGQFKNNLINRNKYLSFNHNDKRNTNLIKAQEIENKE
jgi:hypothetical protein